MGLSTIPPLTSVCTEFRVGSVQIRVDTVPISPSPAIGEQLTGRSSAGTSLSKRVVNNACTLGCTPTCVNIGPTAPTSGDCSALRTTIQTLATNAQTGAPFPCNLPNQSSCPNFTVAPGFEQTFTLGTCVMAFQNKNPGGGPSVSYCYYLMAGIMPTLSNCITVSGFTGGGCDQTTQIGSKHRIELRHA
ncbi:hypothetical protein BD779DRAFT_309907 [Infundibulicybe gibba]|nr:hypothetical protein BD779DRAFT_309907 [Infundibulicybe gibba]